jgi:hypothetical protein
VTESVCVEHHTAAEGVGRREPACNNTVAGEREERALHTHLPQILSERTQSPVDCLCAVMDVYTLAVARFA